MNEPHGGILDKLFLNDKIVPGTFLDAFDAFIENWDRRGTANSLAAKWRARFGLDPLPMGAEADEQDEPRFIVRLLTVRALTNEYHNAHPDLSRAECRKKAKAITDAQIEEAARKIAAEQGYSGITDWWSWLLANWQRWLPALITILIALI